MIIEKIKPLISSKLIYIPLIFGNDIDITVLIKKNDFVLKGMKIGKTKQKTPGYIYSSISGIVKGFDHKECCNGRLVKCIIIENNWLEKRISDLDSNHTLLDVIQNSRLIDLQNNILLSENYQYKIQTLIINTIVYHNQILYNEDLLLKNIPLFLEIIDNLMEIKKIKECIIVIPKNYKISKKFNQFLGTYPKIRIFKISKIPKENQEKYLTEKIKHCTYRFSPIEKQIVIHTTLTIFSIYHTYKYCFPPVLKEIAVIINQKKEIINAKIGTEILNILPPDYDNYYIYFIYRYKREKIEFNENMIVDQYLDGIELVLK